MNTIKKIQAAIKKTGKEFIADNRGEAAYAIFALVFVFLIALLFIEYNHGITIYNNVQKEMEQAVSAAVLLSIDDEYRKDQILYISDIEAAKATCIECIKEDMGLDDLYRKMGGSGKPAYYLTDLVIAVDETPPYLVCLGNLHIPVMICPASIDENAEYVIPMRAAAHAQSLLNSDT